MPPGLPSPLYPTRIGRRHALLLGLTLLGAARPARAKSDDEFTGFAGTVVRFASVDDARRVLAADDDWLLATGEFQRRAVMGVDSGVTIAAFRRWNADAARPWAPAQRARWRQALQTLAPSFAALRVPLPKEVLLIHSNGQESANAPYTRANAVVLPTGLTLGSKSDAELLAHELFHVVSRHAPRLADALYAAVGFEPTPPLAWPAAWASIRIANPDAPDNRHALRATVEGRSVHLMPVLVAARTSLDKAAGETFFHVMDVRLLEVEPSPDGRSMQAVQSDGQPVWQPLREAREYLTRLGGNTGYVIHPEEALADNFAFLCLGRKVRNPALIERIATVLRESSR
jgi:hypothetical protein